MTDRELMQQALWTLEDIFGKNKVDVGIITALRERLAQPEQEPVVNASAWWALVMGAAASIEDALDCMRDEDAKRQAIGAMKHYREKANALYAAPQPRQWVGLTDEERDSFWKADQMTSKEWDELFNAIEAKLREKNA